MQLDSLRTSETHGDNPNFSQNLFRLHMNDKRRQKVKGRQEMKSVTHKGYVKWYSFGKHAVPNYRHEIKIVAPTWIQ